MKIAHHLRSHVLHSARESVAVAFIVAATAFAIVVTSELFVRLVVPTVVLAAYKDDYLRTASACEKARRSTKEAEHKRFESDRLRAIYLATIDVQLVNCLDREVLKAALLTLQVSSHSLRALELEAIALDPRTPLNTVVAPVESK